MKILFSSTPGDGHLNPLLPLARALIARGHQVVFAASRQHARKLSALGIPWLACGPDNLTLSQRLRPYLKDRPPSTSPDFLPFTFVHRYAVGDAPERVSDLRALVDTHHPDLLIFESFDLATPIVSAATNIPAVHHSLGRTLPASCYLGSATYLEPLWSDVGVEPPPMCGTYENNTYVDVCPTSIQGPGPPSTTTVLRMSPADPTPSGIPPPWLRQEEDRPNVYVTLGTVFNRVELFRMLLSALADESWNIIVTVGDNNDPAELGPQPPNVHIERFVPQSVLLPHVSAMVTHAGSGSMLAALSHGVPLLMLPQAADQYENAQACTAAGVARTLTPDDATPERIARELRMILTESSYRRAAAAIRDEIDNLPSPDDVARVIAAART